jgi:hypothetical protein
MNFSLLLLAQIGFTALTVIYFSLFFREVKKGIAKTIWDADRKKTFANSITAGIIVWFLFIAFWSLTGIMSDFSLFPFNFVPVITVPLIMAITLTFSRSFTEVLKHIPQVTIIKLQSFRFFVEIFLWILFIDQIIPVQMTVEGRNFDILAGITSPGVAWLMLHSKISKTILVVWNITGLILLINIVLIAVLSTPSPIRTFMNEPANTIVTHIPVSLLPGMLVPLAYMLHFFSLRQLLVKPV